MLKYFVFITFLFTVDRFTKIYILKNPSVASGGFLDLHFNANIAFSLPLTQFILYPAIALILVFLVNLWFRSFKRKTILIWPIGLVIIGAVSNVLDRIYQGGVVDFINVPMFTVFNLADVYISLGVVWLLWHTWFYKKQSLDKSRPED